MSWLSVNMLADEQLARMDETEKVGEFYMRISVPGQFRVEGGTTIGGLTAYLDGKVLTFQGSPILLKMFARESPDWPVMNETEVLNLAIDEAGLLAGEPIQVRHQQLVSDKATRAQLSKFLDTQMSSLTVDEQGRLIDA